MNPQSAAQLSLHPGSYLTDGTDLRSWLLTTDHKRIGILYALAITFFFFLGSCAALVIRMHLLSPTGALVTPETYNRLFTFHGMIMVWFFLIPSIPTTLGNFLLPLMIGAKDLAFPKLNLASWYIYMISGVCTFVLLLVGGADTGWTFYPPYSSLFSNSFVGLAIVGIFINGFSSILTGLNFIATIHKLRTPDMTWFKLPLFVWSLYATSLIFVLATPVLAITLLLLAVEHFLRIGIFDPTIGGDPILFQHLFWFYSHPAVYIMVLPGMGVVSEIIPCFARRKIYGYKLVAYSSIAIGVLGFLLWGHHMFVSGQSAYTSVAFSLLSFLIGIPSGIKVFNWTVTLYKGQIWLRTPMLYVLGFVGLFTIGGLTGLFLAALAVDVHLHDTYFVIAHFHYIMVGGTLMAYLGGLHFWWPKITGKLYSEKWGRVAAIALFIGFNLTFFPQFYLGYLGMPRRYATYPPEFQFLNIISTSGVIFLGIGYALPLFYLGASLFRRANAPANPWEATGLEWTVTSPPPTHNFDHEIKSVLEPYQYNPNEVVHV